MCKHTCARNLEADTAAPHNFTLLCFTLLYFTLLYFTLLYSTLLFLVVFSIRYRPKDLTCQHREVLECLRAYECLRVSTSVPERPRVSTMPLATLKPYHEGSTMPQAQRCPRGNVGPSGWEPNIDACRAWSQTTQCNCADPPTRGSWSNFGEGGRLDEVGH